jgi:FtsH-binding integral membrane protein
MGVDAGLRAFMLGVYNKVGLGLVLSAALAYVTGTVEPVQRLLFQVDALGRVNYTIIGMVVAFAPLGILLFQAFARRTSPSPTGRSSRCWAPRWACSSSSTATSASSRPSWSRPRPSGG